MKLKITFLFLLFTTVFYAQTLIISDSGDVGAYESPTIASKTVGAAQFFSGSDATSNRLSTLADASFNSVEETSSLTLSNNIADTFYNQKRIESSWDGSEGNFLYGSTESMEESASIECY